MAFGANSSISGQWMRSSLLPTFVLPACASTTAPSQTITGSVGLAKGTIEECEKGRKKIEENIRYLLISNDDCGNETIIVTSCDDAVVRPRKTPRDGGDKMILDFIFGLSSHQDNIADRLTVQLKNISNDVIATPDISCDSFYPVQAYHDGSILCAQTAIGTFYNTTTWQAETCSKGSYQDRLSQTSCFSCPPGYTTAGDGATSAADCYKDCPAGQYCDVGRDKDRCMLCRKGMYNDQTGRTSCTACANGLGTENEGSKQTSDCKIVCKLGEQLDDNEMCVKCIKGEYREDINAPLCSGCPSGLTTDGMGSQHKSECSDLYCPADRYRSPNVSRTGINPDTFDIMTYCPWCPQARNEPRLVRAVQDEH